MSGADEVEALAYLWLVQHGYASIEEWAREQDLVYHHDAEEWYVLDYATRDPYSLIPNLVDHLLRVIEWEEMTALQRAVTQVVATLRAGFPRPQWVLQIDGHGPVVAHDDDQLRAFLGGCKTHAELVRIPTETKEQTR